MRESRLEDPLQSRVSDSSDDLATLLQASPDAVIVVDADGVILLASSAVETLFGFHPSEIVGQPVEKLLPEQFWAVHERHRKAFMQNSTPRPMGIGLELEGCRDRKSVV